MRIIQFALIASLMALIAGPAFAQGADAVLGTWVTDGGKSRIEITKSAGKYSGKIAWLREANYPPDDKEAGKVKHDRENPDDKLKNRPLLGLQLIKDFKYAGENVWAKGTIYDPENGKTYKCKMTLKDPKTLDVRGYIGISLIGRTTVWKRYEKSKAGAAASGKAAEEAPATAGPAKESSNSGAK